MGVTHHPSWRTSITHTKINKIICYFNFLWGYGVSFSMKATEETRSVRIAEPFEFKLHC